MELNERHFLHDDAIRANEDPDRHAYDDLQPDIGNFNRGKLRLRCSCGRWQWDQVLQRWCIPCLRLVKLSVTCDQCRDFMGVTIDEYLDEWMTPTPFIQRRNHDWLPKSAQHD